MSVVEVIEDILDQTFLREDCKADSLVRIDEEIYDCDKCILADTLDVKRDDILGREICPLDVKGDIYALR